MKLSPHERALDAGLQATRRAFGVPVTYARGATTLTVSRAVQGDTYKGVIEVGGSEQIVELQDWLIGVTDLASMLTPQVGDLITRDGTDHVFTVEYRQMGEPAWDWADTAKTQYLIRTRKDGAAAYEVAEPTGFDLAGNALRDS